MGEIHHIQVVYLSLEIFVSHQLFYRNPDFYESSGRSTRIILRSQCSAAWLHQEDFFLISWE